MITVAVNGALGRMGKEVCSAVLADPDLKLCALCDPSFTSSSLQFDGCDSSLPAYNSLDELVKHEKPQVIVDFTRPDVVEDNLKKILSAGIHCVLGTTGLSSEKLHELYRNYAQDCSLFFAPNFTTGAVLMMMFSRLAAQFFEDAEIIEYHHNGKKDAPSGTAVRSAELISEGRLRASDMLYAQAPGKESELPSFEGARGALSHKVPIHSVRSNGYVAHQEVIFGSKGQTLCIRHDSIDRASYMPGVVLAIKKVAEFDGCVIGLEALMGLDQL